jgi:hypothetical protein
MQVTDFKVGPKGVLYVTKSVPEDAPIFTVTVPASDEDLAVFQTVSKEQLDKIELVNFVKIPWMKIMEVWSYFSAVYKEHKSEALAIFHLDPDTNEYTVVVPESYLASSTSLSYDPNQESFCPTCKICSKNPVDSICPRCPGEQRMKKLRTRGTMHSHGNMGAFHSGTDDDHEKNQTGFHITMGKVDAEIFGFELCPSFVVALHGYRNEKNEGVRYYPSINDLVDFANFPLADPGQVLCWMSTVFTPKRLTEIPDSASVVVETCRDANVAVFVNSEEGAKSWLQKQPDSRSFHVLSGSELKKELPPTAVRNGEIVWQRKPGNHHPTAPTESQTGTPTCPTDDTRSTSKNTTGGGRYLQLGTGRNSAIAGSTTRSVNQSHRTSEDKVIDINAYQSVDYRSGQAILIETTSNRHVDPWVVFRLFTDKEIPEEVFVYGMRRLAWELDNWSKNLEVEDSLEIEILQFQKEVAKEIGDLSDQSDMVKEMHFEKHGFLFLAGHKTQNPRENCMIDTMENLIEKVKHPKEESQKLSLKLAYITSLVRFAADKQVLKPKESTHWWQCLNRLSSEVLDFAVDEKAGISIG